MAHTEEDRLLSTDPPRLEPIKPDHRDRFLAAVARSRELHQPWVFPPATARQFDEYIERYRRDNNIGLLAVDEQEQLIGCINLNEIVRGALQSAYLAYYAFIPFAGNGEMKKAMESAIRFAFKDIGLHRLEANIQPANTRSKNLALSLGFRLEGFSPHYLRIANSWKDHERYALTIEDLRPGSAG